MESREMGKDSVNDKNSEVNLAQSNEDGLHEKQVVVTCDGEDLPSTDPVRPEKMDGGWGWLVVLGAAVVNMMFGINYRMFGLVYLEMRDRFKASATAAAWVGGLNLLLGGFCGPVGAWLLQHYSHRTITAIGSTLAVVGMIGTGYVPNLQLAYVTYGLLTGVGIALAHQSAVAMVGEYFDKRKALALALQSVTSGLSALVFSPLMGLLFTEFHYPGTFLIFGGIFTNMFISSALFRPIRERTTTPEINHELLSKTMTSGQKYAVYEVTTSLMQITKKPILQPILKRYPTRDDNSHQHVTKYMDINSHGQQKRAFCPSCRSMFIALRNPIFLSFFLLLLSATAGRAVTSSFLPALALEFGTTLTEASLLPAISGVAAAVGSLIVGAAFDTKPILKYRVYLYAVNTFFIGATMLWMPFTSSFTGLAIPTALNGVSSTVIFAQQMTVLTDLLGKEHAVAGLGVIRVALALGSILGRTISAIFVDLMATNTFGFYITSCLPMVASVFFVTVAFVRKDRNEIDTGPSSF